MPSEIKHASVATAIESKSLSEPASQEKAVTLIYRGHAYHRPIDRRPRSNQLNRTLMYRGNVYHPQSVQTTPAASKIVMTVRYPNGITQPDGDAASSRSAND